MDGVGSEGSWAGLNQYQPRGPFLKFHQRRQRWAVMVAHRRAGKTVACVADLVIEALFTKKQDARYAYIAPQWNQAKDVAWLYVKRLTADIPGVTYNETELRANLPNGSVVRLYGADNPDRLRGIFLDGVILDEYADMKPRVWGEVIRPLLADRKGWAAFIGTPKGKNEFYRVWASADSAWFRLMLKASDSGLLDPGEVADARKSMTEDQFAQEFDCSFDAAILGAFYGREMRMAEEQGRVTDVGWDPALKVYTAWDLGYSDDTAIWWYQVFRGEVRILEYYSAAGESIQHYAKVIKDRPYGYHLHWLPHDAKAKTLASGGKSIEEMLRGAITGQVVIVPDLSVQDGIQAVRAMLPNTWFDAEKCADGIEAMKQYQREWDDDKRSFREKPRHDWTSHGADAFRMLAIAAREMLPAAPKPKAKFWHDQSLDEMWRDQPTKGGRI